MFNVYINVHVEILESNGLYSADIKTEELLLELDVDHAVRGRGCLVFVYHTKVDIRRKDILFRERR